MGYRLPGKDAALGVFTYRSISCCAPFKKLYQRKPVAGLRAVIAFAEIICRSVADYKLLRPRSRPSKEISRHFG